MGAVRLTLSARLDPRRRLRQETITGLAVAVHVPIGAPVKGCRRGCHHRANWVYKDNIWLNNVVYTRVGVMSLVRFRIRTL